MLQIYSKRIIFLLSKLKLHQIFILSIEWSKSCGSARGSSYDGIKEESRLSPTSITDWMQIFRDICVKNLNINPRVLVGEGLIVEIDKALFARWRYNRGQLVQEQLVFGGYRRITGLGFLMPVENRSAESLLHLIEQFNAPGSIIYSNRWLPYRQIPKIPNRRYQHFAVNYNTNFVNQKPVFTPTGSRECGVEPN